MMRKKEELEMKLIIKQEYNIKIIIYLIKNIKLKKFPNLFGLKYEDVNKINRNSVLCDIDTVDGYQVELIFIILLNSIKGMERDLIIFSAVRCNKQVNLIYFLSNKN